jgi:DNA repair protein RadC
LLANRYPIGTTKPKQCATRSDAQNREITPNLAISRIQLVSVDCVLYLSKMVHNHPSGDPTPSKDDVAMTKAVAAAAEKLGILLHDHVVVGR